MSVQHCRCQAYRSLATFADRSTNLQEQRVVFIALPDHLQFTSQRLPITSDIHLVSALRGLVHSPHLSQWAGHPTYAISLGVVTNEHNYYPPQGTEWFIWGETVAEAIVTIQLVKCLVYFRRLSYSLSSCHKHSHYALLHVAALRLLSLCLSPFLISWFLQDALETPIISNAKHRFRSVRAGWSSVRIQKCMGMCLTCSLINVSL